MAKMKLFHMVKDKIDALDPELMEIYSVWALFAELGYWIGPFGIEEIVHAQTQAGEAEVSPEEDKYVIRAHAYIFPFLVYEIAKGIYEWISLDAEFQNVMSKETVGDETKDILAGPGVFKKLYAMLPAKSDELWPLVQKKLLASNPSDVKEILSGSDKGQRLMKDFIDKAKSEWETYQKSKEEYRKV